MQAKLNDEVTEFLDDLNHPLRAEIEILREKIINVEEVNSNESDLTNIVNEWLKAASE